MRTLLRACVAALATGGALVAPAFAQQVSRSPASGLRGDARDPGTALGRDPFVRPTAQNEAGPGQPEPAPVPLERGLPGLRKDEISVRGVLRADGRHVALVQGPDKRHYVIRPGDRLRDGVVQEVIPGGLVMVSDRSAPVGDRASKPVRKTPRPHGEGQ